LTDFPINFPNCFGEYVCSMHIFYYIMIAFSILLIALFLEKNRSITMILIHLRMKSPI
jgi:hypothetical protein